MKRARQACGIVYGEAAVVDSRLAEIDCGEFEGLEETAETMSLFWDAVQSGSKGTESFKAFMIRNLEFCHMIANRHESETILIITHAANARIIHYYFSGKPVDYDFRQPIARNRDIIAFVFSLRLPYNLYGGLFFVTFRGSVLPELLIEKSRL